MNVTDVDPEMITKREAFIRELRASRRKQGTGQLCAVGESYSREANGYITDPAKSYWCCIGVGCNLIGYTKRELLEELDTYYKSFREEYGITPKQLKYLMAMNDGAGLRWTETPKFTGYMSDAPVIRNVDAGQREFPFIARFLELMWGMRVE